MGPLGIPETVFIFVLALLIFGPKKLPELGRTIGKAMTEFRRASSELRSTFDREMNSIEREANLKEVTNSINGTSDHDSYYDSNYDSNYYDYGSYDGTTQDSSTVSASATQGAETGSGTEIESETPQTADASHGPETPEPNEAVKRDEPSNQTTQA